MAEVFGTAAAVLGALETCAHLSEKLIKTIRNWKNAPDEIQALQNEIVSLDFVLKGANGARQVLQLNERQGGSSEFADGLGQQVREARAHLTDLENSLEELSRGKKASQRWQWLTQRSSIMTKKKAIRHISSKINDMLVACNA